MYFLASQYHTQGKIARDPFYITVAKNIYDEVKASISPELERLGKEAEAEEELFSKMTEEEIKDMRYETGSGQMPCYTG